MMRKNPDGLRSSQNGIKSRKKNKREIQTDFQNRYRRLRELSQPESQSLSASPSPQAESGSAQPEASDEGIDFLKTTQIVLIALFLVYIGALLAMKGDSRTPFDRMEAIVTEAAEDKTMVKADGSVLRHYYGINASDYEGVLLLVKEGMMEVDELLLVKLKSPEQAETIEAAVEKRRGERKESFEGYGAEQTRLIEDSVTEIRGNYVLFVIGDNAQQIHKAFMKGL